MNHTLDLLRDMVERYHPFSPQEERDKENILFYLERFPDLLERTNPLVHGVSSAVVLNQERTHVLMVHHNIYKEWSLPGGHADGEENLLLTARREAEEETGLQPSPLGSGIFSLDLLPVIGHYKNGAYLSPHIHIAPSFLFSGGSSCPLRKREEENSAVGWIPLEDFPTITSESHMRPVYRKIAEKIKAYKESSEKPFNTERSDCSDFIG